MLRLDFTLADLSLPQQRETTRRVSISGVQDKVQLHRQGMRFVPVASGGDYILKPVPSHSSARFVYDIPANEALTMDIASEIFGIHTAEHALVEFKDGMPAYLTKRFDFRDGMKIRQEDFCQLSNRSEETHGDNYKYDASYEELAGLVRRFCPSHAIENSKVFFQILFNYVFANGDAHLKNFSLYESRQGDYILTPAYDLLNTSLHFPNEPTATGLDFFMDGHYTARYEVLGFYSSADFHELAGFYGVSSLEVDEMLSVFARKRVQVEESVKTSRLSLEAKSLYLAKFHDRLKALAQ